MANSLPTAIQTAQNSKIVRILDIGTGINTTTLEIFGDRWDVTPSDVNVGDWNSHIPGMIELNVVNLGRGAEERDRCGSTYEGWEAIIMSEVLEHIPPTLIPNALAAAYAALKPNGILVITVPFMYRIHEYGDHDPETVEPSLKDYGRITPSGMVWYLEHMKFVDFWVGRLVKDDLTTFPAWESPKGVVAWARKATCQGEMEFYHRNRLCNTKWSPNLPEDWREQQTKMAEEYERRLASAREQVEPV